MIRRPLWTSPEAQPRPSSISSDIESGAAAMMPAMVAPVTPVVGAHL